MKGSTALIGIGFVFLMIIVLAGASIFTVGFLEGMNEYKNNDNVQSNATTESAPPEPQETSTNTNSPPSVEDIFYRIANMPYKIDPGDTKSVQEFYSLGYGDCDDKSIALAYELYQLGYRDIYIVVADGSEVNLKHAYVKFQGRIFDATPPIYYNVSEAYYEDYLIGNGFEMKRTYKYYPGIWNT